jgi:hypothetical protein
VQSGGHWKVEPHHHVLVQLMHHLIALRCYLLHHHGGLCARPAFVSGSAVVARAAFEAIQRGFAHASERWKPPQCRRIMLINIISV